MTKPVTAFTEIEGKILNIKPGQVRTKLKKLGAKKVEDYDYKRYVFDVIPASSNAWVRLRTDGKSSSLTVKEINNDSTTGTEEWEVEVSDFDTTLVLLQKVGLTPRGYQENRRELFLLNGVEVCIDEWPGIPPYLEIEGKSVEEIEEVATKLGYKAGQLIGDNTDKVYAQYGINLKEKAELRFSQS